MALLASTVLVSSCNNNLEIVSTNPSTFKAPSFTAFDGGEGEIVVSETNQANELKIQWSAADFGYPAAVNYTLEGSFSVNTKDTTLVFANTSTPSATLSYETINKLILSTGVTAGTQTSVELELNASISSAYTTQKSTSTLTINVTPFKVAYPKMLYVAGGYTTNGWNPAASPRVFITDEDKGVYNGIVNVDNDGFEFKFLGQADWNPIQYGGEMSKLVEKFPDGSDPANITDLKGKTAFYHMNVDVKNLKATAKAISTISLVGGATDIGWDPSKSLPFAPKATTGPDSYVWVLSGVNLKADGFKILFNNSWDNALGANGGSADFVFSGGDAKFSESGIYDIELDLANYPYKATFTKK